MKRVALCLVLAASTPLLSACGSEHPDPGNNGIHVANAAAVTVRAADDDNQARKGASIPLQNEWWSKMTENDRDRIVVLPQSLICGSTVVEAGLPVELTHDTIRSGFVHHLFRRVTTRLETLRIPLNRPGDTTGHRLRNSTEVELARCAASRTHVEIVINIRPLDAAGEVAATRRPRIVPYVLTLSAKSSGGNWHAVVRRAADEAHPAVFPDPRVASLPSATRASIVKDIWDLGQELSQSIIAGAES